MKTLIVSNEEDLREIIRFTVETQFDTQILETRVGTETIEFLKKNTDIHLIISDHSSDLDDFESFFQAVQTYHPKAALIICSHFGPEHFDSFKKNAISGFVIKPNIFNNLKSILQKIVIENKWESDTFPNKDYCAIATRIVLKMGVLHCDLFLRVGGNRYVKLFKEGDTFERFDFDRLASKKTETLYIKKEDASLFIKEMNQTLSALGSKPSPSPEASIYVSQEALEILGDFNKQLGFTPELQTLVKQTTDFAVSQIERNIPTPDLWKKITQESNGHYLSYSIPVGWLSCSIASLLGWEAEATFYKLTLAAILHDLTVSRPELLDVQTSNDLLQKNIDCSTEEIRRYFEHPIASSQLALQMEGLPLDVDTIILHHHERPDGSGFPGKLSHQKIHPLAAVMIISELLVKRRLQTGAPIEIAQFINDLDDSFRQGVFKKILLAITDALVDHQRW